MRQSSSALGTVLLVLLLLVSAQTFAASPPEAPSQLRIFHTANVQGELNPCGG